MFDNLRIICTPYANNIAVNLMWDWKYDSFGPMPSCDVFCCTIPENLLLQKAIFSQEEIIKWINENMLVGILEPQTRISTIEAFYMKPENQGRCQHNSYQLTSGNTIYNSQVLNFPASDMNKVFFVCIYDKENNFDYRVFAPNLGNKIQFTCEEPRSFLGIFGSKKGARKLIFNDNGEKRRVMVTTFQGSDIYTVIPNGTTYYIDNDFDLNSIKEVVYLSTLIGG